MTNNWLENLKSIIHFDLSGVKSLTVKLLSDNSGNKFGVINVDKSRNLTVELNVTPEILSDAKKIQQIQQIIKQAALEEPDRPLLEVKAANDTDTIAKIEDNDETLKYFSDKIPSADVPILKAALFIKTLHEGEQRDLVERHVQELRDRYGKRGSEISKLCTANYFETYLRPLYEELQKRPNFSNQLFVDGYNFVIDNYPFAVFINRNQKLGSLKNEVTSKILINKTYGVKTLNIHAIGMSNVGVLNNLLQDKDIKQHFTAEPTINSEGNIMVAQIFF